MERIGGGVVGERWLQDAKTKWQRTTNAGWKTQEHVIQMEYLQDKASNTHRLFPIVTTSPSGNSYNFSSANDWDAVAVPAQSREQRNTASP